MLQSADVQETCAVCTALTLAGSGNLGLKTGLSLAADILAEPRTNRKTKMVL